MGFQRADFGPLSPNEPVDNMSSSNATHYTQPQYYPTSHVPTNINIVPPMPREDSAQKKRPKYTRSKTGCLTCRAKKIKCDETKPTCIRCTHGQRDCTWPESAPMARHSPLRKSITDDFDGRPSTAGSSGLSDTSTPPTRNHTPPNGLHMGLPPLAHRQSEPYPQINHMLQQPGLGRRLSAIDAHPSSTLQHYSMHQSTSNISDTSMIPEISSYPSQPRYDHDYHDYPNTVHPLAHPAPRRAIPKTQRVGDRFMPHPASGTQWNPPIMPSLDPIDPFVSSPFPFSHGY